MTNPLEAEIAAAEEKDAETARDGLFSKSLVFARATEDHKAKETKLIEWKLVWKLVHVEKCVASFR